MALAITVCLTATIAANAAELPVMSKTAPMFVKAVGNGWNLRGDIRFSPPANSASPLLAMNPPSRGFEPAPFYLLGGTYQFAGWLRSDRGSQQSNFVNFHGLTARASGEIFTVEMQSTSPNELSSAFGHQAYSRSE